MGSCLQIFPYHLSNVIQLLAGLRPAAIETKHQLATRSYRASCRSTMASCPLVLGAHALLLILSDMPCWK